MITCEQRNGVRENLISYTCDVFQEMTLQKLGAVRLVCEIIVQALYDLHTGSLEDQQSAIAYFNDHLFIRHCEMISIPVPLMKVIIENPTSYLSTIGEYEEKELYNERN